jgi:hypothetical protein
MRACLEQLDAYIAKGSYPPGLPNTSRPVWVFSNIFSGGIEVLSLIDARFSFEKGSMVDIDELLAAAIRTVCLQVDGPESRSHHRVEVETARRVRAALQREDVVITQSRAMPEAAAVATPTLASTPASAA